MKQKILTFSMLMTLLTGCTTTKIVAPSCPENNSLNNSPLSFIDISSFDNSLFCSLQSDERKPIEIVATYPFSVNAIPERLNKWLSAVTEQGGKVTVEAEPKTKALIPLLGLLPVIYSFLKDANQTTLYNPTKDYDATLVYDSQTGLVKKITFINKQAIP